MRTTPRNSGSDSRASRSIQMTADAAPIGRVGTGAKGSAHAGQFEALDGPVFWADMAPMNTPILTGEKAEEYKRLYREYGAAVAHAVATLAANGMESEEFRQADAAVGKLYVRLRELQGMAGKSWMA